MPSISSKNVAGASSDQSYPSLALMDPSFLLESSKSNNSSINQTNLIEHMIPLIQKTPLLQKETKFLVLFSLFLVLG